MAPKESSIKKMEKKLYAKQNTFNAEGRKHFSHTESTTATDWVDEAPKKPEEEADPFAVKKTMTGFTKLFIAAFLFLILSVGTAFLVFTSGQNNVSYTNVALSVLGPNTVPGGEVLAYDVIITNDNEVGIELTDIIVKYPEGSYEVSEESTPLRQEVRPIDSIARGASQTERFETVFFGTEGEVKDITITYEYRTPGSNAILFKERVYQVQLESSPVSLEIDVPVEALSGSDVELELQVISNANKVIDNLSLQVEYPFGFEFQEAAPSPNPGSQDIFALGELGVGETKTIKVIGTLSGQDDETRVFKYRVGLVNSKTGAVINTLQQDESIITIARPPVTLTAGIQDTTKSNTREILWQKTDIPVLGTFTSGAVGEVTAKLKTLKLQDIAGRIIDPVVNINYGFSGTTFDFENNEKDTTSTGKLIIKVPTELKLDTRLIHSLGPFTNEGTLQPTVGLPSEYTVVWKVSNSSSLTENIEVSGILPPFVEFKQASQQDGSIIEYNGLTREIVWTIDSLEPGAGYSKPGAETTFQVVVTPSVTQEGSSLSVIEKQNMKGRDTFTNTLRIYNSQPDVRTTSLRTDPGYTSGAESVTSPEEN